MFFQILRLLVYFIFLCIFQIPMLQSEMKVLDLFRSVTLFPLNIYMQPMHFVSNFSKHQTVVEFQNKSLYSIFCSKLQEEVTSNSIVIYFVSIVSEFLKTLDDISLFYKNSVKDRRTTCWHPYIFIYYETLTPVGIAVEDSVFESLFCNYSKEFPLFSDVFFVTAAKTNERISQSDFSVWELYFVKNRSFCKRIELQDGKINLYKLSRKVLRRQNFYGVPLHAIAVKSGVYTLEVSFKLNKEGPPEFESGAAVTLLRDFAQTLNFTEKALVGSWEEKNGVDGRVMSVKSHLGEGLADICISQTVIKEDEAKITYLQPTYNDGVVVFFQQPSTNSLRDIYASAFDTPLWIYMFLTWFLVIASLKAAAWLKMKTDDIEEVDWAISEDSFLWALGSSTQQGWYIYPSSISLKTIFLIGYMTGLLCFIAYSAAIVSTLSVKVVPIKTFADLSSFKVLLDADNVNSSTLQLTDEMKRNIMNCRTNASLPLLKMGHNFLIAWTEDFYFATRTSGMADNDVCKLFSKMALSKTPSRSSMMVKKGSEFREFFNYKFMLVKERGMNYRTMKNYFTESGVNCLQDNNAVQVSLGLNDLFTAFLFFLTGYVLSFAVYLLEKFTYSLVRADKNSFLTIVRLHQAEQFGKGYDKLVRKWYLRKSFARRKKLGQRNTFWTLDKNMSSIHPPRVKTSNSTETL